MFCVGLVSDWAKDWFCGCEGGAVEGSGPKTRPWEGPQAPLASFAEGGKLTGGAPSWRWRKQRTSMPKMVADTCCWYVKTLAATGGETLSLEFRIKKPKP